MPDEKDDSQTNDKELTDERIAELCKDNAEAAKAMKAMRDSKRDATGEAKKLRLKLEAEDKAKKDAEDKALAEQGKYKELADKHKKDADDAKATLTRRLIDFELRLIAVQAGAIDAADVLKLCDREGVKVGEDGETVTGAREAVDALKKSKPFLFHGEGGDKIDPPGSPNPGLKTTLITPDPTSMSPLDRISKGLKDKADQAKK
jgi:hypothetical protein